jgi:hypothetical protein
MGIGIVTHAAGFGAGGFLTPGEFVVYRPAGDGWYQVQSECMSRKDWRDWPAEALVDVPRPADLIGYAWGPVGFRPWFGIVSRDVAEVAKGYLDAALWSSTDSRYPEGEEVDGDDYHGQPLDDWADAWSCSERLLCHCLETARQFLDMVGDDFGAYCESINANRDGGPAEWFGHDLWLTRNRHGCGFWDRGLGELGDRLSEAARLLGGVDLYSVPRDGAKDETEEREVTL